MEDLHQLEKYDMYKLTAAHKTLPIPCYARVTNLKKQKVNYCSN